MQIACADIWLCIDCLLAAVNDDYTSIESDEVADKVRRGIFALGPHLVPDFDSETSDGIREFSRCGCDCCGSGLAGTFHRFATLEV